MGTKETKEMQTLIENYFSLKSTGMYQSVKMDKGTEEHKKSLTTMENEALSTYGVNLYLMYTIAYYDAVSSMREELIKYCKQLRAGTNEWTEGKYPLQYNFGVNTNTIYFSVLEHHALQGGK